MALPPEQFPTTQHAPCACNLRKQEIERYAETVAAKTGYEPGGAMEPVVKQLGGRVAFLSWEDWLSHPHDTISVEGPGRFSILLMCSDGPLRHRFTIAHELGHYFLHSGQGRKPMQAGRDGSNTRLEWEANWFAAAFLMPEQPFREAAAAFGNDPLKLAGRFLVSLEAAKIRLETLGLR